VYGRSHLDPRDDIASHAAAVRELGNPGAVREKLAPTRPQDRESVAAPEQNESQLVVAEPLGHVAAVDQEQLEHPRRSGPTDGERARVETPHDLASDVEDDDDPDSEPHPHATHTERPRRQKRDRRVISRGRVRCRPCRNVQRDLRIGRNPEPPRPQPQPRNVAPLHTRPTT
jgi:hypothetical protein